MRKLSEMNEITVDICNTNAIAIQTDSDGDFVVIYHDGDDMWSPLRSFRVGKDQDLAREIRRHLRADIFANMPYLSDAKQPKGRSDVWDAMVDRYDQIVKELTEAGCLSTKFDMYIQ